MIDVYDMALAGLLHDVGKVMQRAEVEIGRDKYEEYCPTFKGVPSHQHVMWTRLFRQPAVQTGTRLGADRQPCRQPSQRFRFCQPKRPGILADTVPHQRGPGFRKLGQAGRR